MGWQCTRKVLYFPGSLVVTWIHVIQLWPVNAGNGDSTKERTWVKETSFANLVDWNRWEGGAPGACWDTENASRILTEMHTARHWEVLLTLYSICSAFLWSYSQFLLQVVRPSCWSGLWWEDVTWYITLSKLQNRQVSNVSILHEKISEFLKAVLLFLSIM